MPDIEIRNQSGKPVRYVEIGWIVRDSKGGEFMAASVPVSDPDLNLPAGRTTRILQKTALKCTRSTGEPVAITGMSGFVSLVEYGDGKIWVPDHDALAQNKLLHRVLAPSSEEQRLTELYRTKGIKALIAQLDTF